MLTHTGEKRFICIICGKQFAKGNTLNRHMTVHTGEKAYSCTMCMKRFVRRYTWKTHMKKHEAGVLSAVEVEHISSTSDLTFNIIN